MWHTKKNISKNLCNTLGAGNSGHLKEPHLPEMPQNLAIQILAHTGHLVSGQN
jgi:hypothetical protein